MDQINPAQAQRVWQRVQGTRSPDDAQALPRLLALESEAWHTYTYLTKNSSLRDSKLLARLREQSMGQYNALSGLHLLTTGDRPAQTPQPALRGSAEGLLQLAFRNRQQFLTLLNSAQLPAEFAFVLPLLRDQTEEHCLLLLELLGRVCRQA